MLKKNALQSLITTATIALTSGCVAEHIGAPNGAESTHDHGENTSNNQYIPIENEDGRNPNETTTTCPPRIQQEIETKIYDTLARLYAITEDPNALYVVMANNILPDTNIALENQARKVIAWHQPDQAITWTARTHEDDNQIAIYGHTQIQITNGRATITPITVQNHGDHLDITEEGRITLYTSSISYASNTGNCELEASNGSANQVIQIIINETNNLKAIQATTN